MGSLSKLLSTKRGAAFWTPTRIGTIVCDIVLGWRSRHSREFLHLDLKADNTCVLLDRDFRAKICDFGLSRPVNHQGPRAGGSGTEAYAAPEQLALKFDRTTKTEAFPFGLVLYETFGRKLVFGDNLSLEQVVKRIRATQPPKIPDESDL
jgi:serine/threonine protein kinase